MNGSCRLFAVLTLTACGASPTVAPSEPCPPSPGDVTPPLAERVSEAPAAADADAPEGASRPEERGHLVAFYRATRGEDWVRQDFWLSSRPHCEWHGVECDADGYVEQLTLYDNDLAGSLPPTICDLPRLHTLYLSFNRIGGPLPERIGKCRALKNLWVKANQLEGAIPEGICDGGSLLWLDLHENRFTGAIPAGIGRCRALEVLRLDHNQLTGPLPEALGQLDRLREMYLHHNELTGPLTPVATQRGLTHLFVANNRFDGTVPDLSQLSALVAFRAENNQLTGALPTTLASLNALQVLRLDGNDVTGPVPPAVADKTSALQVCALGNAECDDCAAPCGASTKK
ncbi:MAG: hypothetical protein AAF715_16800 [Myxococcota bacterium]